MTELVLGHKDAANGFCIVKIEKNGFDSENRGLELDPAVIDQRVTVHC
jgi:hypothetical protein